MLDSLPRAKARALPADWGVEQDALLIRTKGRYTKIAHLSDQLGVAEGVLLTRWHRLRAEPEEPKTVEVKTREICARRAKLVERLKRTVTPAMVPICTLLQDGRPRDASEIARKIGSSPKRVANMAHMNKGRINELRQWRLTIDPVSGGAPVIRLTLMEGRR